MCPFMSASDRSRYQVAGRMLLRPDLVGQYTVMATIVTTSSGTTNVTKTITAGTYMGVNTCTLCHSGGTMAPDKVYTLDKHRSRAHLHRRHQWRAGHLQRSPASPVTPSATTQHQCVVNRRI